ncbi:hypothetical protein, partial [Frankia sp. AiPs1]|uniref:hypothetical protein n=1 Tax=Frankia sp. AiPs1 TaxID=573493 RepID=UPI0035ABD030
MQHSPQLPHEIRDHALRRHVVADHAEQPAAPVLDAHRVGRQLAAARGEAQELAQAIAPGDRHPHPRRAEPNWIDGEQDTARRRPHPLGTRP